LVVFFELFFEPDDFFADFFVAMALVPPFWLHNLRSAKNRVNVFFQLQTLFSRKRSGGEKFTAEAHRARRALLHLRALRLSAVNLRHLSTKMRAWPRS
jgi:hypothetical protein